jgi:Mor family transcriptional regulator
MKENNWENTRLGIYYGSNTILGSPRGWLQRAVEFKQTDIAQHETSLDPRLITVAGIWRREQPLPDTGSWPALYRFFRLTENLRRAGRARPEEFYPVIGMAVAVPQDSIYRVYTEYRRSAEWVWMNWPVKFTVPRSLKTIRELDHAEIYGLFDRGLTKQQVAHQLDLSVQSVAYVYGKWSTGQSPERRPRKTQDRESVLRDLRSGMRVVEVAEKYNCSRTQIYKIQKSQQA